MDDEGQAVGAAEELNALRRLSAAVGSDPALTQAAGGNTSVKQDGTMWIKASGTWLEQALERDIFVPISLDPLRAAMDRNDPACETCADFIDQTRNATKLRPSVETTVHAVMPQRVVVHVHCVETIAWAVRRDAEHVIAPLLKDFSWVFVPYRRPGIPLSHAMKERLRPGNDVVILGNHGLVVAGETVDAAAKLLSRVTRALKRKARPAPAFAEAELVRKAKSSPYRLPFDPHVHAAATDLVSIAHALKGSLYPDHVVFLGPGVFAAKEGETIAAALARTETEPRLILVPGQGVLVHKDSVAAVEPMGRCLADVTSRLAPDEPVQALSDGDVDALVNWDAEKYRQSLARAS